jgi:signal transduction histidine kinase
MAVEIFADSGTKDARMIEMLKDKIAALEQQLEKEETRFRKEREFLFSLVDGIPAYIYLQAKDYSIRYANKVFKRLYGDVENLPCYKVMNDQDAPCLKCETFNVFKTKRPQYWIARNRNGKTYRIYDYPFADENGEELVLEMGIDITEQQKYEGMRSELFANVSHELRSPLAKIVGFTEILRDNVYQGQADYQKIVNCIYMNSMALNKLIGDLFELSKLESAHSVQLKTVNLRGALMDFCEEQKLLFNDKSPYFSFELEDALPPVLADTNRIIQVLNNLVDNAIRYTSEGDSIRLYAGYDKKGKCLRITVSDTGYGISKEDIGHIFSRFYQGIRKCDAKNHSGLGLNICKTIVEQHHGKITVDSTLREGTTFFITLPECTE